MRRQTWFFVILLIGLSSGKTLAQFGWSWGSSPVSRWQFDMISAINRYSYGGYLRSSIYNSGRTSHQPTIVLIPGLGRSQRTYPHSFVINNTSAFSADVYDGRRYLARLYPGEALRVGDAREYFHAVLLIPGRGGYLNRITAILNGTDNGWNITP